MFQWGWQGGGGGGFVLQMGGFIFKWMGASILMGEFPPCPSTMGNPASYVVTLAIEKIPTKAHHCFQTYQNYCM